MGKYLIDNGVEHKLIKSFKTEKEADLFVEKLSKKVKSRRFRPIIKKMQYYIGSFYKRNRWCVYIPSHTVVKI